VPSSPIEHAYEATLLLRALHRLVNTI
jgi:hypothetical protein